MKRKKIKYNYIKIILIILAISLSIISYSRLFQKQSLYDDIIFFKFLGNIYSNQTNNIKENNSKMEQYKFQVQYNKTVLTNVNLLNSLNVKTLANNKIAPGISGNFEILITSNINTNYTINFESLNKKPQNMKFWVDGENTKYSNLEALSNNLIGRIIANENKTIKINWEWEYENNKEEDIKDTVDGENIEKYNFNIYVAGKVGE